MDNVRAVIFDLDRTLVDVQTFTNYAAALDDVSTLISEWDDPPTPATEWDGPTKKCMDLLFATNGDERWQQLSDLIERHEIAAVDQSRPMAGVAHVLQELAEVPLVVVTLMGPTAAASALAHHGIDLPVVGRRVDLASKPAPDQVLAGCAELGIQPGDAVMVGDSTWDHAAATAAGSRFIGVTNQGVSEFEPSVITIDTLLELSPALYDFGLEPSTERAKEST